jgi:hypothetical protein
MINGMEKLLAIAFHIEELLGTNAPCSTTDWLLWNTLYKEMVVGGGHWRKNLLHVVLVPPFSSF